MSVWPIGPPAAGERVKTTRNEKNVQDRPKKILFLKSYMTLKYLLIIQGGSDKSGIFFFLLLNGTTQLKIIRFY